jgi:hypothetical protein
MSSRTKTSAGRGRGGRRGAAVALILAGLVTAAPAAHAAPPHGEGGHIHHVDTGNGGCVTVDAVTFRGEGRGLHQGANASGPERGPWHGRCS